MKKETFKKIMNSTLATTLTVMPTISSVSVYAITQDKLMIAEETPVAFTKTLELESEVLRGDNQQSTIQTDSLNTQNDNIQLQNEGTVTQEREELCGFTLTDWRFIESEDSIVLSSYIGSDTSICIPGEYEGKQVRMNGIYHLPDEKLVSLTFKTVNGRKVQMNSNSLKYEFSDMSNLKTLDLSGLDTSNIEYMGFMLSGLTSLTSLNLSGLDTSNVIDMERMFYRLESLTTLDLSGFDTSKVKNMHLMFYGMSSLTTLDLSSFDTSNVTDMSSMFSEMTSLTSLNLSSFDTSKVTDMSRMFYGTESLTTLDLSSFDTSNVADMSWMFSEMTSLTSLDLSSFDTSNVTRMGRMFHRLKSLTTLDLSSFNTSKVTNMSEMFSEMTSLTSLDLSSFDTSNVTNMDWMFSEMTSLTSLDLSSFDTSKVTSMLRMFYGLKSLTTLDLSSFNTSKVTDMRSMFRETNNLKVVDLSGFDLSSVDISSGLFKIETNKFLPLLVITKDEKLKNYDFKSDNRAGVQITLNANGGKFSDNSTQYVSSEIHTIESSDDKYIKNLITNIQNKKGSPVHSTYPIFEWRLVSNSYKNRLENIYNQLTGEYKASWRYYELETFTYNTPSVSTTTISGKGVPGAKVGVYLSDGSRLAITTVDSKGNYKLTIPKQKAGTVLTIKQAKSGYQTLSKKVTVLNEFKTFTIKNASTSSVAIYGTGEPGAVVKAFVNGEAISSLTTVNSKGNYKIVIPKQKAGTIVQVKMAKDGYKTISQTTTILNEFKTFTYTTPTTTSTTITGKGVAGAKVGVYTSSGKRLAITTVDSKGNYKLTIPKQKAGTVLTIKQAKSGYQTLSEKVTVLNEFKTFAIKNASTSSVAIYGTGEPGAVVKAFVNGEAISSLTKVNSKGNYKIVIPKQKAGTVVQVKMAKDGYKTISQTTTILNQFKTFTYNTPSTSTTTISGKGIAGAKVGIYTSSGKRLAITTVNSKGNYKLTIPKQKAGTVLTIKQAKSGYQTLAKEIKVVK